MEGLVSDLWGCGIEGLCGLYGLGVVVSGVRAKLTIKVQNSRGLGLLGVTHLVESFGF